MPHAVAEAAAGRLSVRDATTIGAALAKVPADVDEAHVVGVLTDGIGDVLAQVCGGDPADANELRARMAELAQSPTPAAARLEEGFVTLAQRSATRLPGGRLRGLLDQFVDALTPDRHDERDATLHDDRHLDLDPVLDGGWHLRGLLDAETGEALNNVLDRFTAPTNKNDDTRTATQKRHDALHALCEFTAAHPQSPKPKGAAREIVVYARKTTLDRQPGALPARLASGMRLSPATLARLGCDALFTAVLLDEHGHPLKVGRTKRLFTAAQRKAMHVQWGGLCAAKGCTNPGDIAHHTRPWEDGGPTDTDNGLPFCTSTHHDIHTGRKTIQLKDGRWIGPQGFVDRPSPGGPSP
jgi:hypothetical protein